MSTLYTDQGDRGSQESDTSATLGTNRSESTDLIRNVVLFDAALDHVLKRNRILTRQLLTSTAQWQSTEQGLNTAAIDSVARRPILRDTSVRDRVSRFVVLGRWEGVVEEVGRDWFRSRVVDLEESSPDEHIEFPLSEVGPEEKHLVFPGGRFYWTLGRRYTRSGRPNQVSVLRFQRLPRWTEDELRRAKEWAEEHAWLFGDAREK